MAAISISPVARSGIHGPVGTGSNTEPNTDMQNSSRRSTGDRRQLRVVLGVDRHLDDDRWRHGDPRRRRLRDRDASRPSLRRGPRSRSHRRRASRPGRSSVPTRPPDHLPGAHPPFLGRLQILHRHLAGIPLVADDRHGGRALAIGGLELGLEGSPAVRDPSRPARRRAGAPRSTGGPSRDVPDRRPPRTGRAVPDRRRPSLPRSGRSPWRPRPPAPGARSRSTRRAGRTAHRLQANPAPPRRRSRRTRRRSGCSSRAPARVADRGRRSDAEGVETGTDPGEVLGGLGPEMIDRDGCVLDDLAVRLRVQHPQRVGVDAPPRVLRQFALTAPQVRLQLLAVRDCDRRRRRWS